MFVFILLLFSGGYSMLVYNTQHRRRPERNTRSGKKKMYGSWCPRSQTGFHFIVHVMLLNLAPVEVRLLHLMCFRRYKNKLGNLQAAQFIKTKLLYFINSVTIIFWTPHQHIWYITAYAVGQLPFSIQHWKELSFLSFVTNPAAAKRAPFIFLPSSCFSPLF